MKIVVVSDSPTPPTPGRRHINMSYKRVAEIAAELGLAVPGQKRQKRSSTQEPESQRDSVALEDLATQ